MNPNDSSEVNHLSENETKLNQLFERAQDELNALCSENAIQSLLNQDTVPDQPDSFDSTRHEKVLNLELGRVYCSSEQIASFCPGTIISLRQNQKGIVQLFYQNLKIAIGKLIVIDGKLAIQILQKQD